MSGNSLLGLTAYNEKSLQVIETERGPIALPPDCAKCAHLECPNLGVQSGRGKQETSPLLFRLKNILLIHMAHLPVRILSWALQRH